MGKLAITIKSQKHSDFRRSEPKISSCIYRHFRPLPETRVKFGQREIYYKLCADRTTVNLRIECSSRESKEISRYGNGFCIPPTENKYVKHTYS